MQHGRYCVSGSQTSCMLFTYYFIVTVRAKLSSAVYCYRSHLWVVCVCVFVCVWVCYHDNLKLHASIYTELGL